MKKIINGKRYDTETANNCGYDSYGNCTDFGWLKETLYQKRTGEFFLHGQGGARTKYGRLAGRNLWSDGEQIIPLTVEAAQKWAEEHLDADAYEKLFGEASEDAAPGLCRLNLCVPTDMADRLKAAALDQGISVSDLICELAEGKV